jgi:hypothetical protein
MLRIMIDTESPPTNITTDARPGPYMRLTDEALERAKARLGIDGVDELSKALGFANRACLWRARHGKSDVRLGHAVAIAQKLEWPLSRVFKGPADA